MEFLGLDASIPLWVWILAQVLGVITIIFDFISYQMKDQRRYLLIFSIGSFFWMMMFIVLGNLTLILIAFFSVLRSMVFWWIFAKKTPKRILGGRIFLAFALLIGFYGAYLSLSAAPPDERIYHWFVLITALLFVVGQYLPSKHYVRFFAFFYAIAVMVLVMVEGGMNIMGILIELAKIVSIIVFYCLAIRNHFYSKEIKRVKAIVDSEICKFRDGTPIDQRMPEDRLGRLIAKLLRYEVAVIDKQNMLDLKSSLSETKQVMDDWQMANDFCKESEKTDSVA
jgi:hypothetical protein